MDEWEADLMRLNLPTKSEVEALNRQLADLEAQIDQLVQSGAQPKDGN
jgi:polyhydroxyalkanoate synthesis regulator phasin